MSVKVRASKDKQNKNSVKTLVAAVIFLSAAGTIMIIQSLSTKKTSGSVKLESVADINKIGTQKTSVKHQAGVITNQVRPIEAQPIDAQLEKTKPDFIVMPEKTAENLSWDKVPTPKLAPGADVMQFLDKVVIPKPNDILLGTNVVRKGGILVGTFNGKVVFDDQQHIWDLKIERTSSGNDTTDEFVELKDEQEQLMYSGEGTELGHLKELPNIENGMIIEMGKQFFVQLYDIDGNSRFAGNFYAKTSSGELVRTGIVILSREN